jgi:hypothetical protein
VVVGENHGSRVDGQCLLDDLARIDAGAVDRAPEPAGLRIQAPAGSDCSK